MSRITRRATLVFAAAFSFSVITVGVPSSASSPSSSTTYPVKIHAANGTITITHRPTAIVSLSPTATEMLFAIGAGKQVKAVDSYSDYPKDAPQPMREEMLLTGPRADQPVVCSSQNCWN